MQRARAALPRALTPRTKVGGMSQLLRVNNLVSKHKIWLVGPLGNLLLFPSMGRGTCESKYPGRKVVYILFLLGNSRNLSNQENKIKKYILGH
jgi:hypothetical protein